MNNTRGRAISVSSALANLSRPHGIRRSQSTTIGLTPRSVRVVVLGLGGVGKTAMSVRFVTKRYIGDYDPTLETIYRHTSVVDDQLVNFEIMDTAGQEENSLMLEDKCKWGESFIFVYDVTDKYSFDELTRLKFIASYTHSRLRVNFTPCWVLVGNKSDLADHERMVSTEEGMALARDLGCHVFREISVKESMNDSSEVFEDLWREFSKLCPRSPSSSQRRKFSYRIQDKIPVLNSNACACASEALKNVAVNGSLVSTLTSTLKRQTSVPLLHMAATRQCKDVLCNDANNNEERIDIPRNIARIPENVDEDEEDSDPVKVEPIRYERSRRNAVVNGTLLDNKLPSFPSFARRKILSKSVSVDNVFASVDLSSVSPGAPLTSSSTSSSNTSLNSSSPSNCNNCKAKAAENCRSRSSSDAASVNRKNIEHGDNLVTLYHDHCKRNRARRCDSGRYNRALGNGFTSMGYNSTYEVGGF